MYDMQEGGWVGLDPSPPGWEAFTVSLLADLVDGEPRVIGVRIEQKPGTDPAVITATKLRTLPVAEHAAAVYHWRHLSPGSVPDLVAAVDHVEAARQGRRATTAEQVAEIYSDARLHGRAPRAAVCNALSISSRTADRYISEARRRGLLPAYRKGGNSSESDET